MNSYLKLSLPGAGVGIKIFKDRFSGSLHLHSGKDIKFRKREKDRQYETDITFEPESQSLFLGAHPLYTPDEIFVGEYSAIFKRVYEKKPGSKVQTSKYKVRLIFKCQTIAISDSIPQPVIASK